MGDVVHTFPALCDAHRAYPDIQVDWLVEEAFQALVDWHPLVNCVLPVALRRWRKQFWRHDFRQDLPWLYKKLRTTHYDVIIDAQGLLKSAVLTRLAKGLRCGYDRHSIREPLASLAYQRRYHVAPGQHAATRVRDLFAQALDYPLPDTPADFGLSCKRIADNIKSDDYIMLFHGTTWATKLWPEPYWQALIRRIRKAGYPIKLVWGNQTEKQRADRLAAGVGGVEVLPRLDMRSVIKIIADAKAVVSVDTGFAHLAEALDIPLVSIYGATNPNLTGSLGQSQVSLVADFPCAPCLQRQCSFKGTADTQPACYSTITPERVWETLSMLIGSSAH